MYVIARSGAIHRLKPSGERIRARVHYPAGYVWVNLQAGIWATMRRGHLVILRDQTELWRSARRYLVQDAANMNVILAGRPGIVFQVHQFGPWFSAGWHGPERQAGVADWLDMFTRSGNVIAVLHQRGGASYSYAVFSPAGARLATLATGLSIAVVDQRYDDLATGTFWFLTASGDVARTDGVTTSVIANTRALGFTSLPALGLLGGGLVQLLSSAAGWRQGQVIL